jgi:hypothetical protein
MTAENIDETLEKIVDLGGRQISRSWDPNLCTGLAFIPPEGLYVPSR